MNISAINVSDQFRGKVKEIIQVSVICEIDEVVALLKSTEVSIAAR